MRGRRLILSVVTVGLSALVLCPALNADTWAYWRFEDGSSTTTAIDSAAGGNDGTISGASYTGSGAWDPVPQTGASNNNALSFDGSDDYVSATVSDHANFTSDTLTVEAFFTPQDTTPSKQGLVTKFDNGGGQVSEQSWALHIGNNNAPTSPMFSVRESDGDLHNAVLDASIEVGQTYAVAGVLDATGGSGEISIHLKEQGGDWVSASSTFSDWEGMQQTDTDVRVGSFGSGSASDYLWFADGTIDEARISGEALSEGEMLATPEPGTTTLALLAAGFAGMLIWRRRKDRPLS